MEEIRLEEIRLLARFSLVILIVFFIFVIQQNYKFRIVWNKIANRYNLIWEEYTLQQEYKQVTIRLPKWLNIFKKKQ